MCYTESSNIHVLLPHKNLHKQKCKFPRIKFGKPEQTKMLCKYPNKSKEKEINWTPCSADRHICMNWCGWPSKGDREVEEREKNECTWERARCREVERCGFNWTGCSMQARQQRPPSLLLLTADDEREAEQSRGMSSAMKGRTRDEKGQCHLGSASPYSSVTAA